MLKTLTLCAAFLITLSLFGAATVPPPGGKSMFPKPGIDMLPLGKQEGKGEAVKVKVEGQPFKEALRLSTYQVTANKWDVQVDAPFAMETKAGDVILAEFYLRAVESKAESGEAKSEFVFERVGDPWTKAVEFAISVGPKWKKFFIPFTCAETLPPGKSHISFRMGYGPQVYELADLKMTTYGDKVKLEDLPRNQVTYDGMEADASWRQAAADRIEKIRKGDLTLSVTDAKGKPLAGAKVSVRMKRHAFGFGTAVVAGTLAKPGAENERYQKEVERLFNRVVFENDLKWGPWEEGASNTGYWRRSYVEGAMKWLSDRHIDVRGHNMVWGNWQWIPGNIKQLQNDKPALEKAIESRIQDVGGAMKGQLVEWDVVNEPVPEHQLTDIFGKQQLVTWYQKARLADPKALLFVNDYPSPDNTGHLDGYEETIKFLLANKAPLQGIGLQGHVGSSPWSIPSLLQVLDRFGAFQLPIEITEYDTDIKDEALDAQFLKDFMTAVFSHPSTNGFLMWGFWDGAHWHHKAPLFNQDWSEKASGKAYEDLVFHDWWTNAEGTTGAEGSYKVRGFLGEYEVTIKSGSKTKTVAVKLTNAGLNLPVVLK